MDQKGISIILFVSVVCGIEAYIPHRYHFVNENKTWSEAQTYCRENYTDLATINNMEEMMKLKITLMEETAGQVWIGLQSNGTGRWRWSLEKQSFYPDGDAYTNWGSGEPNNYGGNESCANMAIKDNTKGGWFDCTCNLKLPFVCYDGKNTGTNRYIFINEKKAWFDAQTYCREKYTDLVSVRNQTENEDIMGVSQNSTNEKKNAWIGLFNDFWKWSDQSDSSFRSSGLLNAETNTKRCAAVNVTNTVTWTNENCDNTIPFICHENQLILIKKNLTWKEALRYCRNNYYDLVSVRTEQTQPWVKEAAQDASTEHVWLGLRHTCVLGFWYWVTGEMICYQDWAPGNGAGMEDCIHEERTGAVQSGGEQQWISLPQSSRLNFICSTYED